MDWTEQQHAEMARRFESGGVLAVASYTVDLVQARGGMMTGQAIDEAFARGGPSVDEENALRQHIAAQGATVATLQTKVAELEDDLEEKDKLIASGGEACDRLQAENDRLDSEAREAWASKSAWKEESDAMRAEVEKLKVTAAGEQERSRMLLDAKNHWAKRARAAESRLAAIRAEIGAYEQEEGPDLLATIEGIRSAFEGDAPQEAVAGNTDRPPCVCDIGHAGICAAARHPCSATCTHDDAATPGHPEREKERSEAVIAAAGADDVLPVHPKPVGRVLTPRDADAYEEGVEAMRAACWEAVQGVLQKHGWSGEQVVNDFKAAIEGAAP